MSLFLKLKTRLNEQGCPFELVAGPQRLTYGTRAQSHIELSRDRGAGDGLAAGKSRSRNPQRMFTRSIGWVLRVYAAASGDGSDTTDHEALADTIVDQLIQAIDVVVRAENCSGWEYRSGRLVSAAELNEPELKTWPGVIYELAFQVNRSVLASGWAEAVAQLAADEVAMGPGPAGVTVDQGEIVITGGTGGNAGLPNASTRLT